MSLPLETRIAKTKSLYNAIPTILWSLMGFTPIGYFCYVYMELMWIYLFLALSLTILFLPDSFFQIIRMSANVSFYQKIGIRIVKKLTQDGDLVNRNLQRKFSNQRRLLSQNEIKRQISRSYFNEKMHFAMFTFFLLTAGYAFFHNFLMWALVISLTNIVFNIYPIFLQQYNRLRIRHIVKRQRPS